MKDNCCTSPKKGDLFDQSGFISRISNALSPHRQQAVGASDFGVDGISQFLFTYSINCWCVSLVTTITDQKPDPRLTSYPVSSYGEQPDHFNQLLLIHVVMRITDAVSYTRNRNNAASADGCCILRDS